MKYLLILCLFLASCVSYEVSACRHRAVECALIYGEKVPIAIAIGPSKSTVWHAQTFLPLSNQWLVNTGHVCEIGKREDFTPQIYMTLGEFMRMQFSWVK